MAENNQSLSCPNCGFQIDVSSLLSKQIEDKLRNKYNEAWASRKKEIEEEKRQIQEARDVLDKQKEAVEELALARTRDLLQAERQKLETDLRNHLLQESEEKLKFYQEELARKTEETKKMFQLEAALEKEKREKEEMADKLAAEHARKLSQQLMEEREKMNKSLDEQYALKLAEREKVIEQLREQIDIAKRKGEQGSMQLQGEVQELAIEDWLRSQFPLDDIVEIKKGARGGDCYQVINTYEQANCGIIYYESKRTKEFQEKWVEKFKDDMRQLNAHVGVLVTEVRPRGMERFGLREGIWICNFEEFRGLCAVLRESIIQVSRAVKVEENKGDKMVMLYDYLTGNEFRLQIEGIVEAFIQLKQDLDSERRAMEGIWKKREKQIDKVILNTNYLYSSIRGIAGSAVSPIQALEMPNDADEDQ